jgi:hypothetical protein
MAGWLVDLLINDLNRRNFDVMAAFRFHQDYVNLLFFFIFYTMLQSLYVRDILGIHQISNFLHRSISVGFFW